MNKQTHSLASFKSQLNSSQILSNKVIAEIKGGQSDPPPFGRNAVLSDPPPFGRNAVLSDPPPFG